MSIQRPIPAAACFVFMCLAIPAGFARDLTFQERVKAQEAIERVYYSHQIGATKPFEEAVPRAILEEKVRKYLKQSVALEKFWNTPITAEMLHRELDRMARDTRLPDRLAELFAALDNNPRLVEECLGRAVLADRLSRDFFAFDAAIHAKEREKAEALQRQIAAGRISPAADHPDRSVVEIALADSDANKEGAGQLPPTGGAPTRLDLPREEFDRWRARFPKKVGVVSALAEEREGFVIRAVLDEGPRDAKLASFVIAKRAWDHWWREVAPGLPEGSVASVGVGQGLPVPATVARTSAAPSAQGPAPSATCGPSDTWDNKSLDDLPDPRVYSTAIWTGSLMVVWGGNTGGGNDLNTGGRYDPATDSWAPTSTVNAPARRSLHTAVWTGSLMVVWGGNTNTLFYNTGGRYNPATDSWTPTSTANAPAARNLHTAVWTNNLMIVWGGSTGASVVNTGGRYDPATDTWSTLSTVGAPTARESHSAIWTGSLMVVWGGTDGAGYFDTGGRYDPLLDTWTATKVCAPDDPLCSPPPTPRTGHTAVWTGSLMVIWGGHDDSFPFMNTGGRYDPATDSWLATSTDNAPSGRFRHTAVWTGSPTNLMVVWGGTDGITDLNTGGRYDPSTDIWTPTFADTAPAARSDHMAIWTGTLMIVWGGGYNDGSWHYINTGGRYDPAMDSWTPTSTVNAPSGRYRHTAIWTGSLMVVWGGFDDASTLNTGGCYNPATDSWTRTSTVNPPSGRSDHTAVWTGSLMIVWGGFDGATTLDTGGRYNPVTDTWSTTSPSSAPAGRSYHTAIWTGSLMIVWGGFDGLSALDTGGRYDPSLNTWRPTCSSANPLCSPPPTPRGLHTAVWTGSQMVVWGGNNGTDPVNTGSRYDPVADVWTPTSTDNAPDARSSHTAVWTGSPTNLMVVWGGYQGSSQYLDTGGRYDPVTDLWTPTSTVNAPAARTRHTAVWTGALNAGLMVVWGGRDGSYPYFDTGGRYDPATDLWSTMSTINAPTGRYYHTAVWADSLMLVWGGKSVSSVFSTGGRYDLGLAGDYDGDGLPDVCETGVILADADHSGRVDGFDLARLGRAFGKHSGDAGFDKSVDFNRDGLIDGQDLEIFRQYFGDSVPSQ